MSILQEPLNNTRILQETNPELFPKGYSRRVQRSRQPTVVPTGTPGAICVNGHYYAPWNPAYPKIGFTGRGDLACFTQK